MLLGKYIAVGSLVILISCFALICDGAFTLDAEEHTGPPRIDISVVPSHTRTVPGGEGIIAIVFDMESWAHLQDDVAVTFEGADGIEIGEIAKPKGTYDKSVKAVFHYDKPHFAIPFKVSDNPGPGERKISVNVEYSPCSDQICFGRFDRTASFSLLIGEQETSNPDFAAIEKDLPEIQIAGPAQPDSMLEKTSGLEGSIASALEKGSWTVFLLVFLGGIATSFTPCVFPMIPITVSYFGSKATGSIRKGFFMSLLYVLGLAVTYSILGVIAGATGAAFGSIAEHPVVIIIVVTIFLILAASMFGAFELQLPSSITTKITSRSTTRGLFGPFFLGLVLGFIAAPCVGPVIIAILTFIAHKQSIMYGFWLMFFFALGMGLLFVIIGTFSGAVSKLPKPGPWMVTLKKIFGTIMVGMAIYFIRPILPPVAYSFVVTVALIIFGVFIGAFTPLNGPFSIRDGLRKAIGIIAITVGIYSLVVNMMATGLFMPHGFRFAPESSSEMGLEIAWLDTLDKAIKKAEEEGKPIMIDFYADNCPACIEMDNFTYSDPEVIEASKSFIPAKLYSNANKDIVSRYKILGYPAAIFIRPDGIQIGKTAYGFISAEKFRKRMDEASDFFQQK